LRDCLGTVHLPVGPLIRPGIFVELMAGSRRMALAVAKTGVLSVSFEVAGHPEQDVLSAHSRSWLRRVLASGLFHGVWIGLVCSTWSLARRNTAGKPGWPAPLRDSGPGLWGLPGLSERDELKVSLANRQARWAVSVFQTCHAQGSSCFIENPETSRLWLLPPVQRLRRFAQETVLHMCAFKAAWKKPTRILACHSTLATAPTYQCSPCAGVCSYSKQRHCILSGRDPATGDMMSSAASVYPKRFCEMLAKLLRCSRARVGPLPVAFRGTLRPRDPSRG
jgi:hypothetical protein